jgi:hypothetical protein
MSDVVCSSSTATPSHEMHAFTTSLAPKCRVVCVCLYSRKSLSEIGGGPVDFPPGPLGQHQPACKPGSVDEGKAPSRDGHSSATPVARRLEQPTRTAGSGHRSRGPAAQARASRRPYSVLLPVGFAVPLALPQARCALTAPFHPYRPVTPLSGEGWGGGLFSVALSLGSTPAGRYPAPYAHGARTFLPDRLSALARAAVQPTDR